MPLLGSRNHAKSTVLSLFLPIYMSLIGKTKNLMLVSQSNEKASTLLISIQAELQYNDLLINDFGDFKLQGAWTKGKFTTKKGWHCTAIGIGQDPRGAKENGNRPDFIICDDIDSSETCYSKKQLDKLYAWLIGDLAQTTSFEMKYKFVMVGNRYAPDMILTRFIENLKPFTTQVNVYDENGLPSWKERFTLEDIEDLKKTWGNIAFQREFMNIPIIEGSIFKKEWMNYRKTLPLNDYEIIITYFDPSYSATGDYKAVVSVGYKDREYHIIDIFLRKTEMLTSVKYLFQLKQKYENAGANHQLFMEANFAQGDNFRIWIERTEAETGYFLPIFYDETKKQNKIARIESMTPYFELNALYWNIDEENNPDFKLAMEQLLTFSAESENEDFADALESCMHNLSQQISMYSIPPVSKTYDQIKNENNRSGNFCLAYFEPNQNWKL